MRPFTYERATDPQAAVAAVSGARREVHQRRHQPARPDEARDRAADPLGRHQPPAVEGHRGAARRRAPDRRTGGELRHRRRSPACAHATRSSPRRCWPARRASCATRRPSAATCCSAPAAPTSTTRPRTATSAIPARAARRSAVSTASTRSSARATPASPPIPPTWLSRWPSWTPGSKLLGADQASRSVAIGDFHRLPGETRRPARPARRPRRTRRSCGPTCPTGACPRRGSRCRGRSLIVARLRSGCPLPHDVLVLVVLVERAEHQLHLHADLELRRRRRRSRAARARPSARASSSTAHTVYGTNGSGDDVRLGRRVVVRRPRPQRARSATARPARVPRRARSGCPTPRSPVGQKYEPDSTPRAPSSAGAASSIVNQPSTAGTRVLLTTALPDRFNVCFGFAHDARDQLGDGRQVVDHAGDLPARQHARVEAALDEPGPQQHRRVRGEQRPATTSGRLRLRIARPSSQHRRATTCPTSS